MGGSRHQRGKCAPPLALASLQDLCARAATETHPEPASEGGAWYRTRDQHKNQLNEPEDEGSFVSLLFER